MISILKNETIFKDDGKQEKIVTSNQKEIVSIPRKRFLYTMPANPSIYLYCLYCPTYALEDSTYIYLQVSDCISQYSMVDNVNVNWSSVISPYEWLNKKFAFCNEGEIPNCGHPPELKNIDWECESFAKCGNDYSVYSTCLGRCMNEQKEILVEIYCNESLIWEIKFHRHCFMKPFYSTERTLESKVISTNIPTIEAIDDISNDNPEKSISMTTMKMVSTKSIQKDDNLLSKSTTNNEE